MQFNNISKVEIIIISKKIMKLIEFLKDLDIFSETVQFNAIRQRLRNRTLEGALLTISIFVLTFAYFVYQSFRYFDGQMDPKFRSQTFVSNDISFQLNNEMFGFDFFSVYTGQFLNQRETEQNKTYIVYVGRYVITNGANNQIIQLDVINCKSPELKGMKCFDFSKISNPSLVLTNHDQTFSYLNLFIYKCNDIDQYKQFVPDNCAEEQLIDNFLTYEPYNLAIKTQISQYNTTSQQVEYQYKSQTIINSPTTVLNNELKIQNQVTKVWKGLVVQSESTFSSPFSQTMNSQSFDRKQIQQTIGYQFLTQVTFNVDEQVTYFTIQYPVFAEVLALCNSVLALLLVTGTFCRKIAQNLIRRNIFFILMKEFFSGTYLNILQHNKIITLHNQTEEMKNINEEQTQENQLKSDDENKKNIILPLSITKPGKAVNLKKQANYAKNVKQDHNKEDSGSIAKQADEFLESLRTNEDKIIKKEINLDKDTIFQAPPNQTKLYENHIDNENEKEQVPSVFSSKSQQKQFQLQVKDINYELIKGISNTPKCKNVLNQADQLNYNQVQEYEKNINKNNSQQINKSFQSLNDKSFQQKLQNLLFKTKLFKRKEFLESKGLKQKIISEFDQQIDDSLDFYTFYKEILLLKKAIMILLNKEQYAALQVIGIDIEKLNQNFEKNIMVNQKEENNANHFKDQYEIQQSKKLQSYYINNFLKRCQENRQNLDVIDQRILSSLLINQQN
ncbi:transmembrane protein, putative (macronuclear) [Tetrahymena thermophila SB210]|uniref:Transmembrane protein, putative n=1 Tax=Tetrahymena thermophila (strain SB210) TaxID=312017 RepID=W7XK90_TETTS|nr:transmembrane protein, putative [Tetrahymena thermophila SB210]EWS74724.1 transmembrane protein, putative [Tetrahymena thermophila SB210]|eukprot:XP_012652725.1 transmembrane protein, putative [Tetrahymena thermophila SB210]